MSAYADLADRLMLGRGVTESGITYARRVRKTSKHVARNEVLSLFSPAAWGRRQRLNILTMPALDWSFERALLDMREPQRIREGKHPRNTYITAVERNPAIFHAALDRMPGADRSLDCSIPQPAFTRSVVRTLPITRFYNCGLDEYVTGIGTTWATWGFDAAWIDLTGPVTEPLLNVLGQLWARTERLLVLTSLKARWPTAINAQLAAAGGLTNLLLERLPWSVPLREYEYGDGSPMHQIALLRVAS